MTRPSQLLSLGDLAAAGVRLRASDAATIARDVALRTARGDLPGIPSPHVIRLDGNGTIQVEGPVASGREIERAARLLEALLPRFDDRTGVCVPGGLRLVIARALRVFDLPPYESLDEFAEALRRFSAEDAAAVVRALIAAWRTVTQPQVVSEVVLDAEIEADEVREPVSMPLIAESTDLTISDIRRARRATRLTLHDVSERARIPVDRLRELEWGYMANWPPGFQGRAHLVRYARAAGLDERIVLSVALPLLDECRASEPMAAVPEDSSAGDADVTVAAAPAAMSLVKAAARPLAPPPPKPPRRPPWWAAATAAAALLAVAAIPAIWLTGDDPEQPEVPTLTTDNGSREREVREVEPPARSTPTLPRESSGIAPVRMLSEVEEAAFSPAFATSGSAVFYHSGAGAASAILKADTGGSGEVLRVTRVVDDRASNFHARPSPDGTRIAFDSDRDGTRGVYIADADGRNVLKVSGDGFAAVPSWSPDGRMLAFVRAEPGRPRVWNIWTLDLERGQQTRITSYKVGQPWGAAWFPDGRRIAYSHEARLVTRSLDGADERIYRSPIRDRLVRTPAVSPDGRHVIFQVYRNGGWLIDLETGRMRRVLEDPSAEEFTWSPDGRRIAYHSRRAGKWGVRIVAASAVAGADAN